MKIVLDFCSSVGGWTKEIVWGTISWLLLTIDGKEDRMNGWIGFPEKWIYPFLSVDSSIHIYISTLAESLLGCPKIPQVFQIASLMVDSGYLSWCNAPWFFSEFFGKWKLVKKNPLFVWGFGGKCMEKSLKMQKFNFLLLHSLLKPLKWSFGQIW